MIFEKWEEPAVGHVFYFRDSPFRASLGQRSFSGKPLLERPDPRFEVEIGETLAQPVRRLS